MPESFIPNSFQKPNAYVDEFMWLLTSDEYKVLDYACRRIFGFQKRTDRISQSQFESGLKDKSGNHLDHGTGLGHAAVKSCIRSLTKYGLLIKVSDNDPTKNEGAEYGLQLDSSKADLSGLLERQRQQETKMAKRMNKARLSIRRGSNEQTHVNPLDEPPIYPIEGGVGLLDRLHKIQGNTDLKPDSTAATAQPQRMSMSPDIQAESIFQKVSGWVTFPGSEREQSIAAIQTILAVKCEGSTEKTVEYLKPFFIEFKERYPTSVRCFWLTDWSVAGRIPEKKKPGKPPGQQKQSTLDRSLDAVRQVIEEAERRGENYGIGN
jgi:hypothetical protein